MSSWYHRVNNNNEWQSSGATMKLENALERYGLSIEDVINSDPPIDTQRRACFGNNFTVVKCSQMSALKKRVEQREAAEREQAMVTKYGKEGWKRKQNEEKERQQKEMEDQNIKLAQEQFKKDIQRRWDILSEISVGGVATSIEGISLAKSIAKKEWFLRDQELNRLTCVKVGRSVKYKLSDLILASETRVAGTSSQEELLNDNFGCLQSKLAGHPERLRQYARYLKDRLDKECEGQPSELLDEAYNATKAEMISKVEESTVKFQRAQEELKTREQKVRVLEQFYTPSSLSARTDKENTSLRQNKKQRTADKDISGPVKGVLA